MIRRMVSLSLTLVLLALCAHLARRSAQLFRLERQVAALDQQFGSLVWFDPNRFWVKLIEFRTDNYGWRLHLPPVKEVWAWQTQIISTGQIQANILHKWDMQASAESEITFWLRGEMSDKATFERSFFGPSRAWGSSSKKRVPFLPHEYCLIEDLPREALVFEPCETTQQAFEIDQPIPLFQVQLTAEAIENLFREKRIDAAEAKRLAIPRVYYIGTPAALRKWEAGNP